MNSATLLLGRQRLGWRGCPDHQVGLAAATCFARSMVS